VCSENFDSFSPMNPNSLNTMCLLNRKKEGRKERGEEGKEE
jgi:hypothetical protein